MADETRVPRGDLKEVKDRLGHLESTVTSSWAYRTRERYESYLTGTLRNDLHWSFVRYLLAGFAVLAGAGYVLIQAGATSAYHKENDRVVANLEQQYEAFVRQQERVFNWKRFHDYGVNYVYLAKMYYENRTLDDEAKDELISDALGEARRYFRFALDHDPAQGSTYWELGELSFTYPRELELERFRDDKAAMKFYQTAIDNYTSVEIGKGWRGDAYMMIGEVLFTHAARADSVETCKELLSKAADHFDRSASEYRAIIPSARRDNQKTLEHVDERRIASRRLPSCTKEFWQAQDPETQIYLPSSVDAE